MQRKKSWADRNSIPTGVVGDNHQGVTVCEKNRATVYERRREGIQELQHYLQNNYRGKGVHAVLYGVDNGSEIQYAVFVEDGWLRDTGDSTTCAHCVMAAKF